MESVEGTVIIEDKGALDYAIRARVQAAVLRGAANEAELGATVMKARRSMLFVPGDNPAMLSTAFVYKPDSVMFDLEDAVSPREKDSARLLVFHALRLPAYKDIERVVRINASIPNTVSKTWRLRSGAGRCRSFAKDRQRRRDP